MTSTAHPRQLPPPAGAPRLAGRMALVLALAVFFTSGFAALLYQVIWQRLLAIFSGADIYSATLIVAAFMGGLGTGNLAGGHVADRVSPRTSLLLFGLAELAIGAFGFFSAALFYDFLYQELGHVPLAPGVMAGLLFVSLLWPTFFMGASLPLLARTLTHRIERAGTIVGALYGGNTLGAAIGALVATWWLLPTLGLDGSLRIGAMLNVACAAALLPLAFVFAARRPDASPHVHPVEPAAGSRSAAAGDVRFGFWVWALLFGFSGLLALSVEIVWFRLLGVMMKSTAFTFGTLLSLYLTGLGAGALAGSRIAPRVRRPGAAFLTLQAAALLCAGGLVAVFAGVVDGAGWFWSYLGSYEPMDVREAVAELVAGSRPSDLSLKFVALYFIVPALLVMPATFLMGCSFPLLQQAIQTDAARVGRRVGVLLFANIAGTVLGSVLTGFVLLDRLGVAGTLRLLVAASGVFVWLRLRHAAFLRPLAIRGRYAAGSVATAGALLLDVPIFVSLPDSETLWARLHGTTPRRVIAREDGSGVSLIKTVSERSAVVFVNGLGQSQLPYGGVHTTLGALPAFVHPDPKKAAIIGLGSGDTVYAVAGRPGLDHITCIEIVRPQLETLQRLHERWPYGGLTGLLQNPRIEHVFGDGRAFLMRGGRTFDIIEADALRPNSAYSGNLYSDAYFALLRDRLEPNGLAATWAPTARVRASFVRVFPYVVGLPGMLLGSRDPIVIDRDAIDARVADPRVRDHYAAAGIDIVALVTQSLAAPVMWGPDADRSTLTDFNTDLFPKDEYDLAPQTP